MAREMSPKEASMQPGALGFLGSGWRVTAPPISPGLNLHALSHGHEFMVTVARGSASGTPVRIRYDREQAYADNGTPVRNAYTGRYTVTHAGRSRTFDHGPHAITDEATKRGASPHAKSWAAEQARSYVLGLA